MCLELFYQQIGEKDVNLTINQVKEDLIPEQLYSNTFEMQANEGQVHVKPITCNQHYVLKTYLVTKALSKIMSFLKLNILFSYPDTFKDV